MKVSAATEMYKVVHVPRCMKVSAATEMYKVVLVNMTIRCITSLVLTHDIASMDHINPLYSGLLTVTAQ